LYRTARGILRVGRLPIRDGMFRATCQQVQMNFPSYRQDVLQNHIGWTYQIPHRRICAGRREALTQEESDDFCSRSCFLFYQELCLIFASGPVLSVFCILGLGSSHQTCTLNTKKLFRGMPCCFL